MNRMDDLISRQAAIRWVKTECNPYGKPTLEFESGKKVIEHLEQMPSAERHGRWIDRWFCSNYSGYDYGMTCSVCGKPMYRQLAEKMPPYCPNCGSRMDLGGDTE